MLVKKVYPPFHVIEQIHISSLHSLFKVHFEYGYEFSGETHDFWECLYVLDGELCVTSDESIYNMSEGDLIFHKPLEFHKFIVKKTTGATLLIFSFTAQGPLTLWLRNKVFVLSLEQKEILNSLLDYIQNKVKPMDPEEPECDYYLLPFNKFPYYSQIIVCYLYQLFLFLGENGTLSSISSAPDAIIFRSAINFLNANLHLQPTVKDIAKHCNISEASLKRIFDKYAGISVHKYLLKLKINKAKNMLQDGVQIVIIAERLGFASQSYFSKAFKRETGFTPINFAKQEKLSKTKYPDYNK